MVEGFSLGVSVAVVNSFLRALGSSLQRKHHTKNRLRNESEQIKEWMSFDWLLGFALFLIVQAANGFVLANVPTLVIAPLGGLGLVFNAILAFIVAGESLDAFDLVGTLLISFGAVMISIYGYLESNTVISLSVVKHMLSRQSVHVWAALMWTGQVSWLIVAAVLRRRRFLAGIRSESVVLGCIYCIVASIFSSQSTVLAKCGAELVKNLVIHSQNELYNILPGLLVISIVIYGAINVLLTNEMMRFYDISVMAPLSFSTFVTFNTINSLIFFESWKFMTPSKAVKLVIAMLLIVAGFICLSHPERWTSSGSSSDEKAPLVTNLKTE